MSDMHDTRRLNGGGQDRKLEPERIEPNVPKTAAPAPAPKPELSAPVSPQSAWDVKLWRKVIDLATTVEENRTSSIVTAFSFAFVVCVAMSFAIWRQETNFEERIAAQRKSYEMYQDAMNRQLTFVADENRRVLAKQARELRLELAYIALDAEKDRKTIAAPSTQQICDEEWMNKREGWYDDDAYIPQPHEFIEYDGDPIIGRLHEQGSVLVVHRHRTGPFKGFTEWAWICLDGKTYALTEGMKTLDVRKIQEAMCAAENQESWEPFRLIAFITRMNASACIRGCRCESATAEDRSRAAKLAPLPLTELRRYDGETIVGSSRVGPKGHPFPCALYTVGVLHRSYLYGDECVRVEVCLSVEDYNLLKGKKVFDAQALEDARRNR